jgi:hypothetical protein
VLAQDRFAFVNSLYVLFSSTIVLALTDASTTLALSPGKASGNDPRSVASSVRLVSLFLAGAYFWAGLAKLQPEWLSGRALAASQQAGAFAGPLGAMVANTQVRLVSAWAVPAVELALAALLVANQRGVAVVLALNLHIVLELTVRPDTLGFQMVLLLLAIRPRLVLGSRDPRLQPGVTA